MSWCLKDMQKQLMQLVLLNGFATSPDLPGCEKLCAAYMKSSWSTAPLSDLKASDISVDPFLPPERLFMVKGWNRSLSALGVLYAAWRDPALYEAGVASTK